MRVRARDVAEVMAADVAQAELDHDREGAVVQPVERLLEQLRRLGEAVLVVADLRQQPQAIGAQGVARPLAGELLEQRPRPRAVPGVDVELRRAHAAPPGRVRMPARGQGARLLEQLAGGGPGAARPRVRRGHLERRGDRVVGARRREREVAGPLLGVRDQLREPPVDRAPAAGRGRGVDGGAVQRVRERHPVAVDPQQPGVLGDRQAGRGRRPRHELDGRVRQRGHDQQRLPPGRRQRRDAAGDRLLQADRDGERAAGRGSRPERSRDLEREQRVAARDPLDPHEIRPPVPVPQAPVQQEAEGAEAERPEPHPLERAPQRPLEPQRVGRPERRAHGREHADRPALEPPHGERQRPHGGRVQPLEVVHGDHHRRRARGLDQQRAQGHRDGPRLRPAPGTAGPPEQRDLERVALGRRQGGQELVGRVPDQVVQPDERQPRLGLLAGAAQHAAPARRGLVERGEPDGGLADPGLPLDQERPRTGAQPAEERPREGELPVASDDAGVHGGEPIRRRSDRGVITN